MVQNSTWCSLPWTHTFINTDGQVKPCCRFNVKPVPKENNINIKSYEEINNTEFMINLRNDMINNIKIEGCKRCYEEENSNKKKSLRQIYNTLEHSNYNLDLEKPSLYFIELSSNNTCNLACRMCDSRYSSKWYNDEILLYNRTYSSQKYTKVNLSKIYPYLENLTHLKLTGGEPLLIKDYYKLLNLLIEKDLAKNIELNISTNCTISPNKKIEILSKFKKVVFNLSLDALNGQAEYIRYPAKWNTIDATIIDFMNLHNHMNCEIGLRTTVSVYNIFHMNEIQEYWNNNVEKHNVKNSYNNPTHLTLPAELSITVLPKKYKEKIENNLHNNKINNSLIKYMNSNDNSHLLNKLKYYTLKLDEIRNQNFYEIYPYYDKLFI